MSPMLLTTAAPAPATGPSTQQALPGASQRGSDCSTATSISEDFKRAKTAGFCLQPYSTPDPNRPRKKGAQGSHGRHIQPSWREESNFGPAFKETSQPNGILKEAKRSGTCPKAGIHGPRQRGWSQPGCLEHHKRGRQGDGQCPLLPQSDPDIRRAGHREPHGF